MLRESVQHMEKNAQNVINLITLVRYVKVKQLSIFKIRKNISDESCNEENVCFVGEQISNLRIGCHKLRKKVWTTCERYA